MPSMGSTVPILCFCDFKYSRLERRGLVTSQPLATSAERQRALAGRLVFARGRISDHAPAHPESRMHNDSSFIEARLEASRGKKAEYKNVATKGDGNDVTRRACSLSGVRTTRGDALTWQASLVASFRSTHSVSPAPACLSSPAVASISPTKRLALSTRLQPYARCHPEPPATAARS